MSTKFQKCKDAIGFAWKDTKRILAAVPAFTMALFVISVVLMNLLANKEISTGVSWLALDCGITVSWLSFLTMDMITKRFGARASIELSLVAVFINLIVCGFLFVIAKIPGNWGEFYANMDDGVNVALNNTFGGTWYVLFGSTIAFIVSAIVNSLLNSNIGKLFSSDGFIAYATRSYLSTLIAQFVDNLVFALIVSHNFFGWTLTQCITCSITGCIVELLCEVVFSPIGYRISNNWKSKNIGSAYFE